MKKIFYIIIALVFINECYFVFYHQNIAWKKVQNGKQLNYYEVANTYILYNLVELSGLIISPQTSKLMFVKQFHLPLKYNDVPRKWEENENICRTILSLQKGQTKKITWKDYIPKFTLKEIIKRWKDNDVAIALNGSKVTCLNRTNETICVKWTILTDFYPCQTPIMGLILPEGLFDYLENQNIISTPTGEIIKTYKFSDFQ